MLNHYRPLLLLAYATVLPRYGVADHGQEQLEVMLAARSRMAAVADEENPIRLFVRQQFDEGRCGQKLIWSSEQPISGAPAEHHPQGEVIVIRISDSAKHSGIDQWTMLLYEMENARFYDSNLHLVSQAREGSVDEDVFVDSIMLNEYAALHLTRGLINRFAFTRPPKQTDSIYTRVQRIRHGYKQYSGRMLKRGKEYLSGYRQMFNDITTDERGN